jgi:hypothetical protein
VDRGAVAGLTITATMAAMDMFGKVLPAPHSVADKPATRANVEQVRTQCVRVAPMALGVGVGASLLAKSPWPIAGVVIAMAWMWWQYENAAHAEGAPASVAPAAAPRRYAT